MAGIYKLEIKESEEELIIFDLCELVCQRLKIQLQAQVEILRNLDGIRSFSP